MANTRIPCLKDKHALKSFAQRHIKEAPSKSTRLWRGIDPEDVASNYEPFLKSVAAAGRRLDTKTFQGVMKDLWECPAPSVEEFCKVLKQALSYCRRKKTSRPKGSRLESAGLRISQAFVQLSPGLMDSPQKGGSSDALFVDCDDDETGGVPDEAEKALAQAKALFPAADSSKTLVRTASVLSVASSCGDGSPQKEKKEGDCHKVMEHPCIMG